MDSVIIEKHEELTKNKTEMNNKIFKNTIPRQFLWDFLKLNFDETDTHFQVTTYLFHKMEYNQQLEGFITFLKPFYHNSKRKYIERQINYKSFLTIIRQLCNTHQIKYNTKLVYNKSTYEIEYSIFKF
jgi:hypothetical protein